MSFFHALLSSDWRGPGHADDHALHSQTTRVDGLIPLSALMEISSPGKVVPIVANIHDHVITNDVVSQPAGNDNAASKQMERNRWVYPFELESWRLS